MIGSTWKSDSCSMTATTAQAFSRVGGKPSLVKALAMSAVQPARSEIGTGKALSMTARTFTRCSWRANRDPGPAQPESRVIVSKETPSQAGRNAPRMSQLLTAGSTLPQLVAVLGAEVEAVDTPQIGDL